MCLIFFSSSLAPTPLSFHPSFLLYWAKWLLTPCIPTSHFFFSPLPLLPALLPFLALHPLLLHELHHFIYSCSPPMPDFSWSNLHLSSHSSPLSALPLLKSLLLSLLTLFPLSPNTFDDVAMFKSTRLTAIARRRPLPSRRGSPILPLPGRHVQTEKLFRNVCWLLLLMSYL